MRSTGTPFLKRMSVGSALICKRSSAEAPSVSTRRAPGVIGGTGAEAGTLPGAVDAQGKGTHLEPAGNVRVLLSVDLHNLEAIPVGGTAGGAGVRGCVAPEEERDGATRG